LNIIFQTQKNQPKLVYCIQAIDKLELVPEDGLEPSRSKASDFEKNTPTIHIYNQIVTHNRLTFANSLQESDFVIIISE